MRLSNLKEYEPSNISSVASMTVSGSSPMIAERTNKVSPSSAAVAVNFTAQRKNTL